jgi:hypothetical protein
MLLLFFSFLFHFQMLYEKFIENFIFWVYIHLKRKTIFVQFLGDGMYMYKYIQNVYVMKKDRAFLMSLFHWCMELNFCCTVFARKNKLWIFMIPRAFFFVFFVSFSKVIQHWNALFFMEKEMKKEKKIESTCASIKSFNV